MIEKDKNSLKKCVYVCVCMCSGDWINWFEKVVIKNGHHNKITGYQTTGLFVAIRGYLIIYKNTPLLKYGSHDNEIQ